MGPLGDNQTGLITCASSDSCTGEHGPQPFALRDEKAGRMFKMEFKKSEAQNSATSSSRHPRVKA